MGAVPVVRPVAVMCCGAQPRDKCAQAAGSEAQKRDCQQERLGAAAERNVSSE